jgi:hypothetical protein
MPLSTREEFVLVMPDLKVMRRSQKKAEHYNYYTYPKLVFKINQPEIIGCNQKFLTLRLSDSHHDIRMLLDDVHLYFSDYIKNNFNIRNKVFSGITYADKLDGNITTIKCHFPPNAHRPVTMYQRTISTVSIELHNIWETENKIGYYFVVVDHQEDTIIEYASE